MSTFGIRLRTARKTKKLTQRKLAKLINVAYTSISEWENDHHKPDINILEVLCNVLDVKASWLLSSEEAPKNTTVLQYLQDKDQIDLPDEAKKEIDNFFEYLAFKYKKD